MLSHFGQTSIVLFSLLVVVIVGIVGAQQAGDECVIPEPLRDGLYAAHPTDCGQYLQCLHGRFVVRQCPGGLHWSTTHTACNWPQFANCNLGAMRVDQPIQGVDV
ncbi:hypothetical protein HA402_012925 [Bradysia odoriphaga]|nr:hypothetical protein HA402_012925 [Bradysia odoriphaga]